VISPAAVCARAGDTPTAHAHTTTRQSETRFVLLILCINRFSDQNSRSD